MLYYFLTRAREEKRQEIIGNMERWILRTGSVLVSNDQCLALDSYDFALSKPLSACEVITETDYLIIDVFG
jgi:hypothetical protein